MDFTYRSTTGPYTTVRRQQRLLRLRRLQDGDYDHHTTTGRRLRPSRLQGGDYDHHDYRTATTTITTPGRRLRPSHDYRTATTTITTTGRRLRPSRLQDGDYDDYRAATSKGPASQSRCPPRNVHDNVPPNTYIEVTSEYTSNPRQTSHTI